jgi:predicted transposase YbfD/YdcC
MDNHFRESFGTLKDPRVDRTKRHHLLDIIGLSLLGVMAGCESFEEIEDFARCHESWLERLNPQAFQKAFLDWASRIKSLFPETVVPIDGKTLKGSHSRSKGLKGLHVVSAWSCSNALSLGQLKVDGKTNEISVVPALLRQLMLEGAIVTLDAMGCQKEIVEEIRAQKAAYVISLKGNQGTLEESVRECFKFTQTKASTAKDEIIGDHGRIEERWIDVLDASVLQGLVDLSEWKDLNAIVRMTSKVTFKNDGRQTIEERFFISSLSPHASKRILHAIRRHWEIESIHWALDVIFKEDACRIRNETAALNFSWMRKMGLSFLKSEQSFKASIRRKQRKIHAHPDYALKVFSQI